MSCIAGAGTEICMSSHRDTNFLDLYSLGLSLIDTLDELVHGGHIEPQLAMKVILSFDKCMSEVLADKVKARLSFKVASHQD